MSSIIDRLSYAINYLSFSLGVYDMAEVRFYTEPDAKYFPEYRASWCDFYGDPYSYLLNNGSWDVVSGWVDVAGCEEINIRLYVLGTVGGDTGAVSFTFEKGQSIINSWFNDYETILTGNITGTTEKRTDHVLKVGTWRYIRVHAVNNPSANTIVVRVTSTSAVRPIKASIIP